MFALDIFIVLLPTESGKRGVFMYTPFSSICSNIMYFSDIKYILVG